MFIWIVPYIIDADATRGEIEVFASTKEAAYWQAHDALARIPDLGSFRIIQQDIRKK